ncbi:hypothetical protein D3C75_701620 [compost metagenome]
MQLGLPAVQLGNHAGNQPLKRQRVDLQADPAFIEHQAFRNLFLGLPRMLHQEIQDADLMNSQPKVCRALMGQALQLAGYCKKRLIYFYSLLPVSHAAPAFNGKLSL